ncbi:hypothetical protein CJ671_09650 [Aliarcobacter cryaerophilus]|uniref:Methyltransferase type 11 domain-containing protein n=1 Tax=Aliarcobacter cryaerophilus TaxID=28198 RepID=A0A2S9SMR3_9BACT|nr:methyltransferase domain-containing protein [Aliarcobacter cryaerophilus]PRM87877.1 hypothetical protein CJ671_09650 [Aliarcobacter cryaerophilus]
MNNEKPVFSDKHIDEIKVDKENNFFSPVWDEINSKNIKIINLLDVGCGNGLFTMYAKNLFNCKVTGLDGNKYALELAIKNGFNDTSFIKNFDENNFDFDDNSFDFVLCKDLLEHLVKPDFVLGEIYRVLNKGGYALISVPNHFPIAGRLKFLFKNNIDTFNYFPDSKRWNFPHLRFFTHSSLIEMVELYDFDFVLDLSYHFAVAPFGRMIPFKRSLAKNNPNNFSEAFTFLVKKRD